MNIRPKTIQLLEENTGAMFLTLVLAVCVCGGWGWVGGCARVRTRTCKYAFFKVFCLFVLSNIFSQLPQISVPASWHSVVLLPHSFPFNSVDLYFTPISPDTCPVLHMLYVFLPPACPCQSHLSLYSFIPALEISHWPPLPYALWAGGEGHYPF